MSEKNYLGNGWANEQYELVNLSVNLEKLKALPVNAYGDVKITVAKMKQPNAKTKATHTVYENNYQPTGEQTRKPDVSNDLPF